LIVEIKSAFCDAPTIYSAPNTFSAKVTGHCTDNAGNQGTGVFGIGYDSTPPVLHFPADMTVIRTNPSGAPVTYKVTATDATDEIYTINCVPPSGGTPLL
jgi:hypothetical protein